TIALPPLRERAADIPLLASFYLKQFNEEYGKNARLSAEAVEAMKRYSWPGNVRELKNLLERALTFNDTGVIQASELEFGETDGEEPRIVAAPPTTPAHSLDEMERE